ncbi:Trehalose utilization protein [Leifsonia sp. 98AMF]|nr:Trehalose utilization protein [Leifsonia sp. 197AMF]SDJ26661.1 Trehalose utilization protein [Leifsonia sp. 466MF]SDK55280.1 Trehalose utilization protein [Leifsonia sp. 157MF]SDN48653.1 Trehalose utilization protein [Leifsonia sp. 509MF]SEN62023.1 Trehalose utilization protein [Leifsonia sp. 467MF]SFM64575.1 Trehalose utilization protein [Leifsonia sp. 98AMF]
MTLRVTVWNEGVHEATQPEIAAIYPHGIHGAIAEGLSELLGDEVAVRTATLDDPEHGLSEQALDETDVLLWWGHTAHDRVSDEVVERVRRHVLGGMGLIVLHSGHFSKIFIRMLGTTCSLRWRNPEGGERELVWNVNPTHPIAEGVEQPIVIEAQEMYGEFFDIPTPDDLVFISSFTGGEVFRSGVTFTRGRGKIFYFSPGDQEYPVYFHPQVRRVLANGVKWAAPVEGARQAPQVSNPQPV